MEKWKIRIHLHLTALLSLLALLNNGFWGFNIGSNDLAVPAVMLFWLGSIIVVNNFERWGYSPMIHLLVWFCICILSLFVEFFAYFPWMVFVIALFGGIYYSVLYLFIVGIFVYLVVKVIVKQFEKPPHSVPFWVHIMLYIIGMISWFFVSPINFTFGL